MQGGGDGFIVRWLVVSSFGINRTEPEGHMMRPLSIQALLGVAAGATLISVAGPALADPTAECSARNSNQIEIGTCMAEVMKAADEAMSMALEFATNAAADLDKTTGRESAVPALKAGQEAWSQYRDKHCEFVGTTFGGGSGTGIAIQNCRIESARDRYAELMQFVQ
jgi:uncharacterized protein YecT (DUF1311 family)